MTYQNTITRMQGIVAANGPSWAAIDPESAARMVIQNRFATGLDIAKHTAKIMRADMAAYDANPAQYTQSLGCWHGFIAQQKLIAIKKHFGTTKQRYLYLSGWMVAALRSEFGPLPDQSMHEKTSVPALIEELYTFLKQADARELGMMFRDLDHAQVHLRAQALVLELPLQLFDALSRVVRVDGRCVLLFQNYKSLWRQDKGSLADGHITEVAHPYQYGAFGTYAVLLLYPALRHAGTQVLIYDLPFEGLGVKTGGLPPFGYLYHISLLWCKLILGRVIPHRLPRSS